MEEPVEDGVRGNPDVLFVVLSKVERAEAKGNAACACRAWRAALENKACWEVTMVSMTISRPSIRRVLAGLRRYGALVEQLSVFVAAGRSYGEDSPNEALSDEGGESNDGEEVPGGEESPVAAGAGGPPPPHAKDGFLALVQCIRERCVGLRSLEIKFTKLARDLYRRGLFEPGFAPGAPGRRHRAWLALSKMQLALVEDRGSLDEFGSNVFGGGYGVDYLVLRERGLVDKITSSSCGGCFMPGFVGEDLAMCREPGCGLGVCKGAYCHYVVDEAYFGLYCGACGDAVCQQCWELSQESGDGDTFVGGVLACGWPQCDSVHILCRRCPAGDLGDAPPKGWFRCTRHFPGGEGGACGSYACPDCVQVCERTCSRTMCPECDSGKVDPPALRR